MKTIKDTDLVVGEVYYGHSEGKYPIKFIGYDGAEAHFKATEEYNPYCELKDGIIPFYYGCNNFYQDED